MAEPKEQKPVCGFAARRSRTYDVSLQLVNGQNQLLALNVREPLAVYVTLMAPRRGQKDEMKVSEAFEASMSSTPPSHMD